MTAAPSVQDHLPELIAEKEREVAKAEQLLADLSDGTLSPSAWHEAYDGFGAADAAVEDCGIALDLARKELDELTKAATGRPEHGGTR